MTASLHLRNVRLVDPEAGTETEGDLLIEDGRIAQLGDVSPPANAETLDCAGKTLAPGIVDLGVYVGEPGARHRESYRTAGLAAAAGGVTTFVAMPSTEPPIDDPAMVEFVRRRAEAVCPVNVEVLGALTQGLQGERMSEMGLLRDAGAVAFTDGDRYVEDAGVLRRCLAYAASLNALVLHHPQEAALSQGVATEGFFATKSGLPGVPALAERMGLERDLALAELSGARYHAHQLSTEAALAPLARARSQGFAVTASASIHHLTLNEIDIEPYRTFFKLSPPLRPEADRQALVQAVADGLIDVICSGHLPQDEELKRVPFAAAAHGAVGLETLLPAALQLVHAGAMDLPTLWSRLSLAPARLLGLPVGRLATGAPADLVLFDPHAPFVLDRFKLSSRSKNTPYDGRRMQGRVLATFRGGDLVHGGDRWAA